MSLLGLVRHMTEMEQVYGHRLADWSIGWLYCTDELEDGDFKAATAAEASADLETFREHCARTREVMAALPARRHVRHDELAHAALVLPVPDQGVCPSSWSRRPAA